MESLSVYFINPPSYENRRLIRNFDCATESKGYYIYQPYDFLVLSSYFEKKEFNFIDAIAQNLKSEEVIKKVKKPDLIFLAMVDTNWQEDLSFLKKIHKKFPHARIFVFGDSFIEEYSRQEVSPYITAILINPFELTRDEFIGKKEIQSMGFYHEGAYTKHDLKKKNKVKMAPAQHESFFHPSYRWPFTRHKKYTSVFVSWGCPYSCSYCVVAKFPNLHREASEVIDELRRIKKMGVKEIYFADRSFGVPLTEIKKILDTMVIEKMNFSWSAYFHPNQFSKSLLELMKKSGCHTIITGIESKNQNELKKYGRNIQGQKLSELLDFSKKVKIDVCGDFILGLPGQTKKDILETIHYAIKLDLDYASFNIATPLPGSSIRRDALRDGRLRAGEDKNYDSFGYNKVLSNDFLTGDEIKRLRNYAVSRFYMRPKYWLKRLLKIRSFEHLFIQIQEMLYLVIKNR
jgi:radical SAM superfamily enzyme YgiQ (UPF0313 family)